MESQPASLALRMEITRRNSDGKIVHLSVKGFPVDWPAWRVVDDCRLAVEQGTGNAADRAIMEATAAGHCQFPSNTGGPEWRLFVDEY